VDDDSRDAPTNDLAQLMTSTPAMPSFESVLPVALEYHRAGQLDHADELYGQLTADLPKLAQVVHLRGMVAHSKGEFDLTIQYASQAAALDPSNSDNHNLLGSGYYNAGRYTEAIAAYRKAIETRPDNAMAYSNCSLAMQASYRFHEAVELAQKAIELRPDLKGLYGNVGICLVRVGRHAEAIPYFQEVLAFDPNHTMNWLNLGHVYKEIGQFDKAAEAYQQVLRLAPTDGQAILGLSHTRRFNRADLPWCAQIEQQLQNVNLRANDRYSIHFALGKIYEDVGHYAVAFKHYQHGQQMAATPYDRMSCTARYQAQRNYFTADWFAQHRGYGSDSTAPIFIVGMFRSGSTLVEQILASHSQVFGAGELPDMERIFSELPGMVGREDFPGCLDDLSAAQAHGVANDYLKRRRAEMGDKLFVTDKMLVNFWNLGLIALLFPNAKIIHCHRDPRDTCLSIYSTRFSERLQFAHDLGDLGYFYSQYAAMMEHWRRVLPIPILDVAYEDVVADQVGMTRRILEYCNLPWEPQCLQFYAHDRPISTSSDWQVRQPVYKTAVRRWERFAPYLGKLFDALGIKS
jgi:tetratricopeptide (TPR) repeat protein